MSRPTPAPRRGRSFRRAAAGACLSASLVILPLAMAPAAHAATAPVSEATPAAEVTPAAVTPAATPTTAPAAGTTAPAATAPAAAIRFTWTSPDRNVASPITEAVPFAGTGTPGSIVTANYYNAVGVKAVAGLGVVGEDGTYAFPASFTELLQGSTTASVTVTQIGLDLAVSGEIRGLVRFTEAPVGPFVRADASFAVADPSITVEEATSILGGIRITATGYLRHEAVEVTVTDPQGRVVQISDENAGVGVSTRALEDLVRADVDGTFAAPIILFGEVTPGVYTISVAGQESGLTQGGTVELTAADAGVPTVPPVDLPDPTTPGIDPAGTPPTPIAPAADHGDTLPVTGTDGVAALGLGGLGALLALAGAGTIIVRRRLRAAE